MLDTVEQKMSFLLYLPIGLVGWVSCVLVESPLAGDSVIDKREDLHLENCNGRPSSWFGHVAVILAKVLLHRKGT